MKLAKVIINPGYNNRNDNDREGQESKKNFHGYYHCVFACERERERGEEEERLI